MRRKARIAAIQAVYAWEESRTGLEELLSFNWVEKKLDSDTQTFAALLISGTLDNLETIDQAISSNLKKWSFDRVTRIDLAILRVSTYAILHQNDIPNNVTIDEAVEIAKSYGSPESYRFVNGVLDGIRKSALS